MARKRTHQQRKAAKERRAAEAAAHALRQPLAPPSYLAWDKAANRYPPGFYVYRLIDPRDGLPFYVGKGQRNRAWQHEIMVRANRFAGNRRKQERIESIVRLGLSVEVDVVEVYELESDALDHEFRLVDESPTLTNALPGGTGPGETPAIMARRARVRAEKLRRLRDREKEAARVRHLERRKSAFMQIEKAELHAAEIDTWIDSLKQSGGRIVLTAKHMSGRASRRAFDAFRAQRDS